MSKLTYHLYWIKCANCNHENRFPIYESTGYTLLSSPYNLADVRLLDWSDNAFKEVSKLAQSEKMLILNGLNLTELHRKIIINTINVGQKVFQFIVDSQDGVKYEFSPDIVCSNCGSHNISGWGPTENPYETIAAAYPMITHHWWGGLTQVAKEELVKKEVKRLVLTKLVEIKKREAGM